MIKKNDIIKYDDCDNSGDFKSDESSGAEQCPTYTYSNKSYHQYSQS